MTNRPTPEQESRVVHTGLLSMISRAAVFIAPVEQGPHANGVGSGTIVLTAKQRPVVLTCRHVLKDWESLPIKLGWSGCRNAARLTNAPRCYHEPDALGEVDVAILIPPSSLSETLRPLGQPHTQIAADSGLVQHDDVSISGFPWQYQRLNAAQGEQGFSSFSVSSLQSHGSGTNDHGLLAFEWARNDWPLFNVDERASKFQPAGPALDPQGMSGGSAWRYRPLPPDTNGLWTPADRARIVGVQRSWSESAHVVFVDPVERWRTWVLEQFLLIDEEGY